MNVHSGAWMAWNGNEYVADYTCGSNILSIDPKSDAWNGAQFNITHNQVECVDIQTILQNITSENQELDLYIKCDIEGSEFVVLPRLLECPCVDSIKEIYIEWHERFWTDLPEEYHLRIQEKQNIINTLSQKNIIYHAHR